MFLAPQDFMVWQSGQKLYGDRYTIQRQLGKGGVGITYLAKDRKGRACVVKTLNDEVMENEEYAEYREKYLTGYKDEALRLAICHHPHIVQIENAFLHEAWPCIAMEYVQGTDLGKRIRQEGALPEAEAIAYIRQVGAALDVVHDKGLLHRDLKPENIMVRSGSGEAVLIDFGIAREFLPGLTQTHTRSFTDGYAPVEQYDAQAHRGEFTDVYALAATAYALVTGQVPPPAFVRAISDSLTIPQSLSAPVRAAIREGMRLKPEDRPAAIEIWLKLLGEVGIGLPQPAEIPNRPTMRAYGLLEQYLAAGNWKAADLETLQVMLSVAGQQKEGWLNAESIQKFPCADLRAIDNLWLCYSNDQFGFSVQKQIYVACGAKLDGGYPGNVVWDKFGDKVGWRVNRSWINYDEVIFNISAPQGHLPRIGEWGGGVGRLTFQRCGQSSLARRLVDCGR